MELFARVMLLVVDGVFELLLFNELVLLHVLVDIVLLLIRLL